MGGCLKVIIIHISKCAKSIRNLGLGLFTHSYTWIKVASNKQHMSYIIAWIWGRVSLPSHDRGISRARAVGRIEAKSRCLQKNDLRGLLTPHSKSMCLVRTMGLGIESTVCSSKFISARECGKSLQYVMKSIVYGLV